MIQLSRSYFASRWRVPDRELRGRVVCLPQGAGNKVLCSSSGPCVRPSRFLTLTASLTWLLSIFSVF